MDAGRVAAIAARFGERDAFVSPCGRLTYRQLAGAAAALAARLAAAAPGAAPVLVYGHKEPGMPVAFLACAALGRPYVPADVGTPPARVARIAELAGVGAAVAAVPLPGELAAALRARGAPVLDAEAGSAPAGAAWPPDAGDPHGLAYIMFTSGSSGDPKGVPIRRSAVAHFASWLAADQRPRPGEEVVLSQAPFSFDLSVMDLCLALPWGGTLFAITREMVADPRRLFAALSASGLTMWVSTPSFARFCLAEPRFGQDLLPELRRLIFCGETLPPAVARALLERFPRAELWNTYGPTEATVAVTSVRITGEMAAAGAPLPVGRAAPGMRVWVADADLRPLPEGERGEILIAGPQLSPGYLAGTAAGSATRFCAAPGAPGDRAYRTGDAGRRQDGLLYCEGRLDRQIKLHGYRLELDEIEQHLRRLPGVTDAAVLVVRRDGAADHLVAFVTGPAAAGGTTGFAQAQGLRSALGRALPAYALPRAIRVLSALPMTANGKVDRAALEALL